MNAIIVFLIAYVSIGILFSVGLSLYALILLRKPKMIVPSYMHRFVVGYGSCDGVFEIFITFLALTFALMVIWPCVKNV